MVLRLRRAVALHAALAAVSSLMLSGSPGSRVAVAGEADFKIAAETETCLSDWAVARDVVRRENLVTVEQLAQSPQAKINGQIVKATLCLEANGYIYRLVVRDSGGRLRALTIDAQSPIKTP